MTVYRPGGHCWKPESQEQGLLLLAGCETLADHVAVVSWSSHGNPLRSRHIKYTAIACTLLHLFFNLYYQIYAHLVMAAYCYTGSSVVSLCVGLVC